LGLFRVIRSDHVSNDIKLIVTFCPFNAELNLLVMQSMRKLA